ncbi:DNA polymerase III subunit epsilon [Solimonas terrae]|uniref:DNA polymerase III subunit epsilon n=1 Tax=Solimonas terrae TaxID=1396819 RepID=A0A6M2BNB4_9GAMM|nr:DNA polymerase III subunit epsilon [Solimonas terrae]NGY03675.1 DNA polymerase III subunit epsilon [Solimonas terrae]
MNRQIILDTETTGLEVDLGHRIIEIGCIELRNRRPTHNNFHRYLNPEREIDAGAISVHGITNERVAQEPKFEALAQQIWDYLAGAELIIHNAPFDVGFLNAEFARAGVLRKLEEVCEITDTVTMARRLHPGQKVNLDALCKRYAVDNSNRDFHGALLDARLLADVYLAMTGGQSKLVLDDEGAGQNRRSRFAELLGVSDAALPVRRASDAELVAHRARLQKIDDKSRGNCVWAGELPAKDA